jgi:hypothetical protein
MPDGVSVSLTGAASIRKKCGARRHYAFGAMDGGVGRSEQMPSLYFEEYDTLEDGLFNVQACQNPKSKGEAKHLTASLCVEIVTSWLVQAYEQRSRPTKRADIVVFAQEKRTGRQPGYRATISVSRFFDPVVGRSSTEETCR